MARPRNGTDYDALRRAKKPLLGLDSHVLPVTEARSVLDLVQTGVITVMEARQLIEFPESAQRVLLDVGVPENVIRRAVDYRAEVLTEFDNLCACSGESLVRCSRRRRRAVKIFGRLRRTQEREANEIENQIDARDARDVIAEERICWSCGRLPSTHALDGHGFCRLCYPAEMHARSAAG